MVTNVSELKALISARLKKVSLACLPTPLQECPRLSTDLGINLAIKRDDLTGLALGGNKTRHLEFILARALARGSDCIITMAAVQSNQCRQTAAAARKLGLEVHLVLRGEEPRVADANFLLDRLMGAATHFVPESETTAGLMAAVESVESGLRAKGRIPYVVDLVNDASHDQELAAASYILMVAEIVEQLADNRKAPEWIYLSSGSGGSATLAGTWLGCRLLGLNTRVVGVTAAPTRERVLEDTIEIAERTLSLLGLSRFAENNGIEIERGFVGEGYGCPTTEGLEAMKLAARTEGLVLDPFYTGKALAALIAHVRSGRVPAGKPIIFVHTGGTPLTFIQNLGEQIGGPALREKL